MCKLAFVKTVKANAYEVVLDMIKHQEQVVAGHSTSVSWIDNQGLHVRKAIGKVINFKAKYTDIPKTHIALAHSRFASVGGITLDNQHPIPIIVNGKIIGQGIHNGTWIDYKKYEHMRIASVKNKTDTAIIFAIYSDILNKYGDNRTNRRKALATLFRVLNNETKEANQNLIIMFNDKQVLFSGHVLTYTVKTPKVGIMTFGLDNKVDKTKIYEVKDMRILKFEWCEFTDYRLKPKKVEFNTQSSIIQSKQVKRSNLKDWILMKDFKTQQSAQHFGNLLKSRYGNNYRVMRNPYNKWGLYVRKKKQLHPYHWYQHLKWWKHG